MTSLKYFYEQAPEYHVVAAGSLLGVSVGKVNFLSMYPLNFLEFLEATDNGSLITVLNENHSSTPIATLLHEKLLGLRRNDHVSRVVIVEISGCQKAKISISYQ